VVAAEPEVIIDQICARKILVFLRGESARVVKTVLTILEEHRLLLDVRAR